MTGTNREELIIDTVLEIKDTLKETKHRVSMSHLEISRMTQRIRRTQAIFEKEMRWARTALQALLAHHDISIEPEDPAAST
jgi:hypothetical protein